ncbi:hypothetical protein CPB85DRAFT_244980 [Mucidula mucida]|nr:hypothetical protein CPB85DRAFT_244980 [Mucidula mucida]
MFPTSLILLSSSRCSDSLPTLLPCPSIILASLMPFSTTSMCTHRATCWYPASGLWTYVSLTRTRRCRHRSRFPFWSRVWDRKRSFRGLRSFARTWMLVGFRKGGCRGGKMYAGRSRFIARGSEVSASREASVKNRSRYVVVTVSFADCTV